MDGSLWIILAFSPLYIFAFFLIRSMYLHYKWEEGIREKYRRGEMTEFECDVILRENDPFD